MSEYLIKGVPVHYLPKELLRSRQVNALAREVLVHLIPVRPSHVHPAERRFPPPSYVQTGLSCALDLAQMPDRGWRTAWIPLLANACRSVGGRTVRRRR